MKPLYTPGDTDPEAPGEPGQYPFTRGVHSGMYRDRLWTMRQYAGYGDAAQSNERYRQLISQGATGLSVAPALPFHPSPIWSASSKGSRSRKCRHR